MRIERNLADGYRLIASNNNNDFYIKKIADRSWFAYCFEKNTNINTTMAGFNTKKAAAKCALMWAGWMK
jgi:hypothetical protein